MRIPKLIQAGLFGAAICAVSPAEVHSAGWTFSFEGLFMEAYGQDQHVLTIEQSDATAGVVQRSAVALDTESYTGFRGEVQYRGDGWGAGVDFLWHQTGQIGSAAASAGSAGSPISFLLPGTTFRSTAPGQRLFFERLEDTDLAAWTFDLYGLRQVGGTPESGVELRYGLRIADFDNDYRAVAGIEGVEGLRLDASSNYGAMPGPLVGFTGRMERGRSSLEGHLSQSVVLGEAELTNRRRGFAGPVSEPLDVLSDERFSLIQDVAIPITDVRLQWQYRLHSMISVGLSAQASAWWDVSVPPGVLPVEGGESALHENTIVFYGFGGLIEVSF